MNPEYLPLSCFGKVTCHPEHFEENLADLPAALALRKWVEKGRQEEEGEDTSHLRFLFGVPGFPDLVAGVIRPSRDGSHPPRSYPFAVLTRIPRRLYGRHYTVLPAALPGVWEALGDVWENLAAVATQAGFLETVESTLIPAPAPLAQAQGSYRLLLQDRMERIFQRDDGASAGRLWSNLPGVLERLRREGTNPGNGFLVEMPVSRDLEQAAFDATFWIDLINHQFRLRRYEPGIFLEDKAKSQSQTAFLAFGNLQPSGYAALMKGQTSGAPGLLRPAHDPPTQGVGADLFAQAAFGDALKRRLGK